jgi:hypothetical protein
MSDPQEPVCFTCGHTTGGTLRLNCLPSGQVCPTCRDRLLECLPPVFPSENAVLEEVEPEEESQLERAASWEATKATGPQLSRKGPGQILRGTGPDEPA